MWDWRRAFEHFLAKGWIDDLTPLFLVVEDASKPLGDRAEAAAVMYRNHMCDPSRNWMEIARSALSKLSNRDELSIRQRVELIPILRACGLDELAQRHIDRLVDADDLSAEDRRAAAKLMSDLGDKRRAKELLDGIDDADETIGFLGPGTSELSPIYKVRTG
jgi:hypothetical protein